MSEQRKPPLSIAGLSSASLAYLGDSVLELCVREHLLRQGLTTAAHLNAAAHDYVTAPAQAQAMNRILPLLTEEEAAVYRRGRNNVHANVPKRATVAEYRAATGMECLFAYLHLTQNKARIDELFDLAYCEDTKTNNEKE
jgi:ribonuclease-3 family protein